MRCLLLYEPVAWTREEKRTGNKGSILKYIVGDGFAYNSIYFGKSEMRDFARHLRREGWTVRGSMRQGYYEVFRGKKHRILHIYTVD